MNEKRQKKKCLDCNGTGKLLRQRHIGLLWVTRYEICYFCDGKGLIRKFESGANNEKEMAS